MDGLRKQKLVMQIDEERLMEMTLEELALFDGKEGRPAYAAVNQVIYDMTDLESWAEGMHYGVFAGTDATEEFNLCHKPTILEKLPIVGKLVL